MKIQIKNTKINGKIVDMSITKDGASIIVDGEDVTEELINK